MFIFIFIIGAIVGGLVVLAYKNIVDGNHRAYNYEKEKKMSEEDEYYASLKNKIINRIERKKMDEENGALAPDKAVDDIALDKELEGNVVLPDEEEDNGKE
jgi:hypothetical protein